MSFRSAFGFCHEAIASQKKMKSLTTPPGLTLIIWHIPLNAESFSSLSRMFRRLVHHGRTNWGKEGATSWGQTNPILPIVIAVFSRRVLGVLGRLMMMISGWRRTGTYCFMSLPSLIEISPAAHVALLQTEMWSVYKFWASMGINSPMHGWTCGKHAFVRSPKM